MPISRNRRIARNIGRSIAEGSIASDWKCIFINSKGE
jgi:hypothetical protein